MEMFLTNLTSNERLRIPLLPDRLNVKTGALVISYTIIKTGEVKIPRGTTATGYSFNSVFPSQALQDACYVFDWQEPTRIISLLRGWEERGDTLRFMVTDLSINADVFIEQLTYEYYGAGDVSYTLSLAVRRELLVQIVPAPVIPPTSADAAYGTVSLSNALGSIDVRQQPSVNAKILGTIPNRTRLQLLGRQGNWYIIPYSTGTDGKAYVYASHVITGTQAAASGSGSSSGTDSSGWSDSGGGSSGGGGSSSSKKSSSSKSSDSGTYTVKSGDSLYQIAKAVLGDGSRYNELYELNKDAIFASNEGLTCSKFTVHPGMVLKLPEKKSSTTSSSSSSSSNSKSTNTSPEKTTTTKPSSTIVSVAKSAVNTVKTVVSNIGKTVSKVFSFFK